MKRSSPKVGTVLWAVLAVVVATHLVGPFGLLAQTNVGRIVGVVQDPTQAVVPNASVVARAIATGVERQTTTNAQGAYAIPLLPIGEYLIRVSAPGFKTLERPRVRIVSAETVTLDFTLELGEVAETVEVAALAPAVDTSTATTGTTRVTEELSELPVLILGNNRSVFSLLRTFPGVSPITSNTDDATRSQGISLTAVNGTPEGGALYDVDGVLGQVSGNGGLRDDFSVPPEMIAEMRLNATNAPEYGWNSGVQLSLVTKSGTNQLHGNVFEYFRNDALDSRNFFASKVSPNKQNEYGFTIGGPVVLPGYNGRDKTFFFGMWSGYKFRATPVGTVITAPTALMRQGDFSEWLADKRVIYDPSTTRTNAQGALIRDPFPGNAIPSTRFSPVSLAFPAPWPLPTRAGTQLNFVGNRDNQVSDTNKGSVKVDHNFAGGRQRLSFSWDQRWREDNTPGDWPGTPITTTWFFSNLSWRYRLVYSATLAPNKVLSARAGLNRFVNHIIPPAQTATFAREAGLKGTPEPVTPRVSIAQGGVFGNQFSGFVGPQSEWLIPLNSDLSWHKGTHNMKLGVGYIQNNWATNVCTGCAGSFGFSNFTTGLPGQPAVGVGYASFLLGESSGGSINLGKHMTYTSDAYGFYWQDSWRVTSKLTLDYGLRWDLFFQVHERHDRIGVFDPTIPNPGAGGLLGAQTFYGVGPGRNGLKEVGSPNHVVSPRFGLAYALTPKTVFRASYGLSSNAMFGLNQNGGFFTDTGWGWAGSSTSLDGGVTPAFNWNQGFPLVPPPLPNTDPAILNNTGTTTFYRNDLRAARSQNMNAGFERELPGNLLVKADYVATLSHGLPAHAMIEGNQLSLSHLPLGNLLLQNINSAAAKAAGITAPYPGFSGNVAQALLPFPQFRGITRLSARVGYSLYHSLQVTAQKRFGHGLFFLAGYTLSKQLTNVGSFQGQGVSQSSGLLQHNSQVSTKFMGQLDRTQNLSISYLYQLPFGRGKRFGNTTNAVVDLLIGGWQVAGLHQYVSGDAVAVGTGQSITGNFGPIWAIRNLGVPIPGTDCGSYDPNNPAQNKYLNVAGFSVPGPFTFGNTRVLPNIRNCGYYNENFSIQKVFRVSERVRTLFSTDFTNLFNRHVWTGLQTNVSVPATFGRYTGVTDPRLIQLHLKVEF